MPAASKVERTGPGAAAAGAGSARSGRRWIPATVLLAVGALVGPVGWIGLWDPYELRVAELGRRLALNRFGAPWLAVPDAENGMMTLGALGGGELPFTSVALGFRLFGLHAWAGRLPLALWAVLGLGATAWLVARFADRRAAAYAALVLATTPLYYLQARTMLGDAVTLALHATALAGLTVATFGAGGSAPLTPARRWGAAALGGAALAGGYLCRGALLGVAPAALAVGLAWLVLRWDGSGRGDRVGALCGGGALVLGAVALVSGVVVLRIALADPGRFYLPVGARVNPQVRLPTFEVVLGQLAVGSFPWAGPALLAVGAALRGAEKRSPGSSARALRVVLLSSIAVALALHGALTPYLGELPFVAIASVAALVGVAARDAERSHAVVPVAAMGIVAATALVLVDLALQPLKAFVAYGFSPDGLTGLPPPRWLFGALGAACGVAWIALAEPETAAPRGSPGTWLDAARAFAGDGFGTTRSVLVAAEAALIGLASLAGLRQVGVTVPALDGLGERGRGIALVAWVALPLVVFGGPIALAAARDALRWFCRRTGWARARVAFLALVAGGLVVDLGYYPALARQGSPRSVFATFRERAPGNVPIGALGVAVSSAAYYLGTRVVPQASPEQAIAWLTGGPNRRYLAVRGVLLPALNASFRDAGRTENVPVLDARSSEVLLVSDRLEPGETSQNPLDAILLRTAPVPQHRLDANLGDCLDALGWDVTTEAGDRVDHVVVGRTYQLRIYWRVTGRVDEDWATFVHIDGFGRRFNADHATVAGQYPFRFWRVGDIVADAHPFALEPNFAPGEYNVYYGLFAGARRLPVVRGRHDEDRLIAGKLQVR